ncbi:hypothetical protein AGMMS49949_00390 [Alphaproteobacteria bacterium]|nr:hypothetical protein AGMMS49949_00390 [Alphaproteobacteria bacterium]GHS95840.1 hypothetical protein AGMMS50296_1130 [Alphaproteobacteria bacterium]
MHDMKVPYLKNPMKKHLCLLSFLFLSACQQRTENVSASSESLPTFEELEKRGFLVRAPSNPQESSDASPENSQVLQEKSEPNVLPDYPYTLEELQEKVKGPNFDINEQHYDLEYSTLACLAAAKNDLDYVKFCTEHGANLDPGYSEAKFSHPLHSTTDVTIAEYLLKNGADVNWGIGSKCYTPLHIFASRGDLKMVELLLKYHANVNQRIGSADCGAPLHWACQGCAENFDGWGRARHPQHLEVVKCLVKHGASINLEGWYGETPLFYAEQAKNQPIVDFLKEEQKKIPKYPYTLKELEEKVKDKKFDMNREYNDPKKDGNNLTLLELAADNDDLPYVQCLIEHGAKIKNAKPLFLTTDVAVAEYLLKHGATAYINEEPNMGWGSQPALTNAAGRGDAEKVRLLLKYKADVHVLGGIAMTEACECGMHGSRHPPHPKPNEIPHYFEVVKLLVEAGARVNIINGVGETPLDIIGKRIEWAETEALKEEGRKIETYLVEQRRLSS